MEAIRDYLNVNDGTIYYEIEGQGHPLVLVHGMMLDTRMWDDVVPTLAQHYTVIRYDMRGYGRSVAQNLKVPAPADLAALLDHLGIARAYVLGLSLGTDAAFGLALEHPERFDALVMASDAPIGWETTPEFDQEWEQFFAAARSGEHERAINIFTRLWVDAQGQASDEARARARAIMSSYSFAHHSAPQEERKEEQPQGESTEEQTQQEVESGPSYQDRVAAMRVPTLLIVGERDQPSVLNAVNISIHVLPNAERVIIPGAAHLIPLEKPHEFAAAILDFLQRRDGS